MADIIPPVAQVPASEPAPAAPVTAQSTHDQLAAQLSDPNWKPEATTPVEPVAPPAETKVVETPPIETPVELATEVTTETPPVEVPPIEDTPEPESVEASKGKRFRFQDPADRKFATLRKEGIAPDEAARIAYGIGAQQQEQTPETAAVDQLATWQADLAAVEAELQAHAAGEPLVSGDFVTLNNKRNDLAAEIKVESRLRERDQQSEAQRQAATEAQARATQQQNVSAAVERFPLIADKSSALRVESDRLMELYSGSAFLDRPDAPVALAEQAAANVARAQSVANGTSFEAEMLKMDTKAKPKAAATVTIQPPAKTAPPAKVAVASGSAATRQPDKTPTEQERFGAVATDPRSEHARLAELLRLP